MTGFKGLTPNNVNLIIESSNLDRVKIYNEMEKITAYFEDKNINTQKNNIIIIRVGACKRKREEKFE